MSVPARSSDRAVDMAQRSAASALKTASAASSLARGGATKAGAAAKDGQLTNMASSLAKEGATKAGVAAKESATIASSLAKEGATKAGVVAKEGATIASSLAKEGATKAATAAATGSTIAKDGASKAATAAATAAAVAAAETKKKATGAFGMAMASAAAGRAAVEAAAVAGRQEAASGSSFRVAGMAFGAFKSKLPGGLSKPSIGAPSPGPSPGAGQKGICTAFLQEEEEMRLAMQASLREAELAQAAASPSGAEGSAPQSPEPQGEELRLQEGSSPEPADVRLGWEQEGSPLTPDPCAPDSSGASPAGDAGPDASAGRAQSHVLDDLSGEEEEEEEEQEDEDDHEGGAVVVGEDAVEVCEAAQGPGRGDPEMAARASTHTGLGPPAFASRMAVHVGIDTARVEVGVPGAEGAEGVESLLLEIRTLDLSMEDLRRLTLPELRCVERLGLAAAGTADEVARSRTQGAGADAVSLGLGGYYCATAGGAELQLVPRRDRAGAKAGGPGPCVVFRTEAAGSAPWLLTARLRTGGSTLARMPALCACLHGARVTIAPEVVRAIEGVTAVVKVLLPPAEAAEAAAATGAVAVAGEEPQKAPGCLPPPLPEVSLTLRSTVLDLGRGGPLPLTVVVPSVHCATATALARGRGSELELGLPPVPRWHAPPPVDVRVEPDCRVFGCACRSTPAIASGDLLVVERQWRAARGSVEPDEISLPVSTFLELSRAKLQASEQGAEWETLQEGRQAGRAQSVARDAARRIPIVRELLDDGDVGGRLEAQLAALGAEAEELAEEELEGQLRLRTCEREAAVAVASVCAEQVGRDGQLRRQLAEERGITSALADLVASQDGLARPGVSQVPGG